MLCIFIWGNNIGFVYVVIVVVLWVIYEKFMKILWKFYDYLFRLWGWIVILNMIK